MKIEDIVKALNKSIETKREERNIRSNTHLVLLKQIIPDPKFKIYKTLKIVLYYIDKDNNYPVLTLSNVMRVPKEIQNSIIENCYAKFITNIFNWIGSDLYEQVIKGEYKGYETT